MLEGHSAAVLSVAWSADGRQALSGSEDNTVRVWEVASGRGLRVLEGHSAAVWSVAWSADGGQALSGSVNGVVRTWNLAASSAAGDSAARCLLRSNTPTPRFSWSAIQRRRQDGTFHAACAE